MKNINLFILFVLLLNFSLFNSKANGIEEVKNKIHEMEEIVNNHNAKSLERTILNIMDYNKFFSIVIKSWPEFSEEEKRRFILYKNTQYLETYFNEITKCSSLHVTFNENKTTIKKNSTILNGSYKCSGNTKSLNVHVLNNSNKIVNIEIDNGNFIAIQKGELYEKSKDELLAMISK